MKAPTPALPLPKRLAIDQKKALCDMASTTHSPTKLAEWADSNFHLAKPLTEGGVRYILSQRDRLKDAPDSLDQQHKLRCLAISAFNSLLVELLDDFDDDDHVTDAVAVKLAIYLADELNIHKAYRPKYSNGWLHRFKQRSCLSFCRRHGEAASVDLVAVETGREKLRRVIVAYQLCDVYNMDETAFYYRQAASGSISRSSKSGKKQNKHRLTLAVDANADGGDKLPLLIIGTAMQPRDLQGHDVGAEFDIDYTHSEKGWMTSQIYCDWLASLDDEMHHQGWHILLLADNVSSHDDSAATLTNVRAQPLPPNTTSLLQPMDQGIIASLKKRYMKKKTHAALQNFF